MRKSTSQCAWLIFVLSAISSPAAPAAGGDWKQPFEPDSDTVVLYHFDEGTGDVTRDAMGDDSLTLRANRQGLWGQHDGFGSAARFTRKDDDPNLLIGPTNHDKLHLRSCAEAWTIEAWVKVEGQGGLDSGRTALNIAGTDDEGFSLPTGLRGGWSFGLHSRSGKGTLTRGVMPWARHIGSPRGKDPNHDTSGTMLPYMTPGLTGAEPAVITDHEWHHVAWQFRFRDQTNWFFLDGRMIRRVELPAPGDPRVMVNDAVDVGVPFVIGGFPHSQDPPFHLNFGTFEGQIDEFRISKTLRYPIADRLSIVRQRLPECGVNIPYAVKLATDAADGSVTWKITDGRLPVGLQFDASAGRIHGTVTEAGPPTFIVVEAQDASGASSSRRFEIRTGAGRLLTASLPPAFVGVAWRAELNTRHLAAPLKWKVVKGKLPEGISLADDLNGMPQQQGWSPFTVQVIDANGEQRQREFVLKVLPRKLLDIGVDEHTVALFDWQGPNGKLIPDRVGDESHTLTWTNMGGDRRVTWPGRARKFPQFTGHGEHGFASAGKGPERLDFRTCKTEWTLEAWIRRGGPLQAFGGTVRGKQMPFHFGHVCGTYDLTNRGVWELYLSDAKSPDGSMAPGIHFFGAAREHALENLDPWHRPAGIVGQRQNAGISDTEWHHVAWQYNYAEDLHELLLDGQLIWRMKSPDGRRLVNDRQHDAQFSVSTRLTGYSRYGGGFNYLGEGNFFGQIGEIRISSVRRYGR